MCITIQLSKRDSDHEHKEDYCIDYCGINPDNFIWLWVSDKDKEGSAVVKVIEIPLTQEEYAFGVDKNQPEL